MFVRLALAVSLVASPVFAQEDALSAKRLQTLEMIKQLRAKVTGAEAQELDFRVALLLDEEAASLEAKGKKAQAAPHRAEAQEILQRLARDFPNFRPADVKARLGTQPASPTGSRDDEVLRVARADFDAELAKAPLPALPAGHGLGLTCCVLTSVLGAPVGVVITLTLPAMPDAANAARATTSLGGYSVSGSGEAKILRRPDFAQLRTTAAPTAMAAQRALELAHVKLATLEQWAPFRAKGGYATTLVGSTGQTWNVYLRSDDESFTVNVDLARNKVTRITVGAAATPIPLEK
ncbi:MAG: hypothetical protein JNM17_35445 [Archangium sp.]|nr:hypothetical protein [Archangium sp.]